MSPEKLAEIMTGEKEGANFDAIQTNLLYFASKHDIDYSSFMPKNKKANNDLLKDKDIDDALHRGNDNWCDVHEFANAVLDNSGKLDKERLYVVCREFGKTSNPSLSESEACTLVDMALEALNHKNLTNAFDQDVKGEKRDKRIVDYFIQNMRDGDNKGIGTDIKGALNCIIKGEPLHSFDDKLYEKRNKLYPNSTTAWQTYS